MKTRFDYEEEYFNSLTQDEREKLPLLTEMPELDSCRFEAGDVITMFIEVGDSELEKDGGKGSIFAHEECWFVVTNRRFVMAATLNLNCTEDKEEWEEVELVQTVDVRLRAQDARRLPRDDE